MCEELTSELSSVKVFYERALEQVSVLERSKAIWQSQQELLNQERLRLQSELDRLTQVVFQIRFKLNNWAYLYNLAS